MTTLLLENIGRECVPIGRLRCPRGVRRAQVADSGGGSGGTAKARLGPMQIPEGPWPHHPGHTSPAIQRTEVCTAVNVCASHWQFFVARCRGHGSHCAALPDGAQTGYRHCFQPPWSSCCDSLTSDVPALHPASVALGWRVLPAGVLHVAWTKPSAQQPQLEGNQGSDYPTKGLTNSVFGTMHQKQEESDIHVNVLLL